MMKINMRDNTFLLTIIHILFTTIEENQDPCYAFFEDVTCNNCQTLRIHPAFNQILSLHQVFIGFMLLMIS